MGFDIGYAPSVVKVATLFLLGIVVLSGIDSGTNDSGIKSILITMTENPTDGELMQLDNNIFEFDIGDGVGTNHIPVDIAATLAITQSNLETAIQTAGYII